MTRHGGRLADPGLAAVCARCDEPREAHGGRKHLGACPGEYGVAARRFSLQDVDKPDSILRTDDGDQATHPGPSPV